jgi:DnaK suppressor protein
MDIATHTHLDELRRSLQSRLLELQAQMAAERSEARNSGSAADAGNDFKELAERHFLMHLDEVHALHEFSEMQAVEAALLRMDAGAYGDCKDCGEPIGLQRLRRMPTALRCLACQQRLEQDMKLSPVSATRLARSADMA